MKLLRKYLKDSLKETILAPLFKMLEAFFELLIPVIVARIIDRGIPSGDIGYIVRLGILMIALGIIGFVSAISAQYFAAKCAAHTGAALRKDLFVHISSLGYREIDSVGTHTLITRMTSDINQIQQGVNMFLRLFLRSPFIVFGAAICAFTIGKKTNLVFGITIPVLFAFVFMVLIITMPLNAKVQSVLENVTRLLRENISGVRVVRAFNRQDAESDEFLDKTSQLYKKQLFTGGVSGILNPISYAAINLAIVIIIYVGGGEVSMGVISRGTVVALVNYMSQILVEIIKLANLIILESKSLASLKRVNQLFEVENTITNGSEKLEKNPLGIVLKDVSFAYEEGASPSISNINLEIKPGQTVGIIGGTGSGKTTLINVIMGFYRPKCGQVIINGKNINEYSEESLRENISVVPQKAVLFAGTLEENLLIGNENATAAEMEAAIKTAQAQSIVDGKMEGLKMRIEEGGSNLSGGQKQRLTIARALVKEAGLLVMDDSSSALDYATDASLRSAIKEEKVSRTTIIVSQRIASISGADAVIVMADGEIVGIGTHEELMVSCRVYKEICQTQLGEEESYE